MNTKMVMAGIGLVVLAFHFARKRELRFDNDFLTIVAWAMIVSLIGFAAVTYNNTNDYTYATYFVSMAVWLGAAYVVIKLMEKVHGEVNVEIVCNYLIAVCSVQCLIAISMSYIPVLKSFVDSFLAGQGFMGKMDDRIYGIGCSLDVAGTRFCAVLLMISEMLKRVVDNDAQKSKIYLYLAAFLIISVIGNMISRTTSIGIILALFYLIIRTKSFSIAGIREYGNIWKIVLLAGIISVPAIVLLYYSSPVFYANFRFAFEGFFSLFETGRWEVNSNEILKNMVVFPDDLKTWLIGNGYFENPYYRDPYYIGPIFHGYYMQTDIGYCRFLFYFGIFGLLAFIAYFIKVGTTCMKRFPDYKMMFFAILMVNFIVWCKVSSDIFLVFAIFLCIPIVDKEQHETTLHHPLPVQSGRDGEGAAE
ncbi:MAG: hypothetical protein ACI3ZC_01670 [Candidatus Cryptobacteroides sp.]